MQVDQCQDRGQPQGLDADLGWPNFVLNFSISQYNTNVITPHVQNLADFAKCQGHKERGTIKWDKTQTLFPKRLLLLHSQQHDWRRHDCLPFFAWFCLEDKLVLGKGQDSTPTSASWDSGLCCIEYVYLVSALGRGTFLHCEGTSDRAEFYYFIYFEAELACLWVPKT